MKKKLPEEDKNTRYTLLVLGIIGWVLVWLNAPFGWELPNYALF